MSDATNGSGQPTRGAQELIDSNSPVKGLSRIKIIKNEVCKKGSTTVLENKLHYFFCENVRSTIDCFYLYHIVMEKIKIFFLQYCIE